MLGQIHLLRLFDRLPSLGISCLILLILIGLILWFFGRRLARPTTILCGFIIGALLGLSLPPFLHTQNWLTITLFIACALAGTLLAGVFYRIWISLALALLLATAIPTAALIWHGSPPPPIPSGLRSLASSPSSPPSDPSSPTPSDSNLSTPASDNALSSSDIHLSPLPPFTDPRWKRLAQIIDNESHAIELWWQKLSPRAHLFLSLATLISFILGLSLGLLLPSFAASCQAAFIGSLLIILPARALLILLSPQTLQQAHTSSRAWLILTGLITIIGICIQWSFRKPKADKR